MSGFSLFDVAREKAVYSLAAAPILIYDKT